MFNECVRVCWEQKSTAYENVFTSVESVTRIKYAGAGGKEEL